MQRKYEVFHLKDDSLTKNNVYIISDIATKKALIIDPACKIDQINEIINKYNLDLKMILLTHCHQDHIRQVDRLVSMYGVTVYVSRQEKEYYSFFCENMATFEDEQIIYLGETSIKCIVTPGHTAGSACFLLSKSIFTGDTIFIEGCGLCTSDGGSAEQMYNSIQRIKIYVNDNINVYPGHTYYAEPGKTISYVKNNNIYFVIENKESFISFRMRKQQFNLFDFK